MDLCRLLVAGGYPQNRPPLRKRVLLRATSLFQHTNYDRYRYNHKLMAERPSFMILAGQRIASVMPLNSFDSCPEGTTPTPKFDKENHGILARIGFIIVWTAL
uniref:Uncharacterized protein n=1 Tax=Angiostrongylus cantonensis TaxID=6313 RepID=A0A0K0DD69_ANGCA